MTPAEYGPLLKLVSMLDAIRKCWALLPVRFRWAAFGLFVLMNLTTLAHVAMVGSIFPFLQAISDPDGMENNRVFNLLRSVVGAVEDSTLVILLGCLVIGAVLAANFLGAVHSVLAARFSANLNVYLSTLLFRSYLLRPYLYYLNRNTSEFLRNIFSEVSLVTGGFFQTGINAVSRTLNIVGLGVLLIVVNPWVAIGAALFFGGSYTGIYFLLRDRLARAAKRRADCDNLRFKAVSEAFGTFKELKVLHREPYFVRGFEKPSRRYFRAQERAQLYSILPKNVVETVAFGGMVGVALILIRQYDGIAGALPVLGLFALAGYRLMPAVRGLYSSFSQMRYYRSSVETVHRECAPLIDDSEEPPAQLRIENPDNAHARLSLKREIELRDVSFTYPEGERPAIRNVNLKLPARSRIGFCGKSGSGKTTLADIVLGLLEPATGQMNVDGVTIDASNRADWQRNCGYVPQEIYLSDDTVRRNIAFGIPPKAIDEEHVRRAAGLANLHDFIETELPSGYDTEVGERGVRLSGGQRQRIGIARALYHDPELIVLDEATSSLDQETERAIVEAVESLSGRKTVLMIAHRLTTIRRSDRVVFIENGSVAATGTFDELCSDNENFRRMAEA